MKNTKRISAKQLSDFPDSVLMDIYRMLNHRQWPEALGDKPDGWDEMPNYKKPYMDECETKEEFIHPYMKAIRVRIPAQQMYPQLVISKPKSTL